MKSRLPVPGSLITGWAVLASIGFSGPQQESGEKAPDVLGKASVEIRSSGPELPLVSSGPEPDVEILFASEVRGFYQPCG